MVITHCIYAQNSKYSARNHSKKPKLTHFLNNDRQAPEELAKEETAVPIRTKHRKLKEPLSTELDEFLESSKTLAESQRAINLLTIFPNIAQELRI